MGKEDQRGWMDPAFGYSEEKAKRQQFVIGPCQPAKYREAGPYDQQNANEFLRAPVLCQVPAGNLQRQISPEKNPGHRACLLRVQMQIPADLRQGERDIRAV